MMTPLTPNTQAILLLTAPLVGSKAESPCEPLSLGEFNQVCHTLRARQIPPAGLLEPGADRLIEVCSEPFGRERFDSLLGRGFLLSQMVERWSSRAIWVSSREDESYPSRLKTRLKDTAPPLLFGCGDFTLLDQGGLAVVGSRNVNEELVHYTEQVGRLAADGGRILFSGGAKGIDRAAMSGALLAGGTTIGVMADSLSRAAVASDNLEALTDRRLVLVSPYDPEAGFNVGNAMQRNKVIYALADAALVVTSDLEKGGTWAGAIEQLEKLKLVPVFVRDSTGMGPGNAALLRRGGLRWPEPQNAEEFTEALVAGSKAMASYPTQESFPFVLQEKPRK